MKDQATEQGLTADAPRHTPGRWLTRGNGIVYVEQGSGIMRDPPLKIGSGWIEDAWVDDDADDEVKANARLIAAAPDLLAACQAAEDFCAADDSEPAYSIYRQLHAAIAKARDGA